VSFTEEGKSDEDEDLPAPPVRYYFGNWRQPPSDILPTEDPPVRYWQRRTKSNDYNTVNEWYNPIYTINLFGLISKTNFHQFRIISGTSILRRTVSIVSILWKFKIEWYVLKYTINLFELIPRQISTNFKLYWYKYFSTYSIFS
jgi:hypothetical protein